MGIEIKIINSVGDLKKLCGVLAETFEQEYSDDDEYLFKVLEKKGSIVIGAFVDGEVVGGAVVF